MKYTDKLMILFTWLLLLVLVSGCGFKDIDRRFFVVSIGIDAVEEEKEQFEVTLKFAIPSADLSSNQNEFILVSHKAKSMTEAIRIIKTKVDKELDFSHAKVVVFGEEFVKREIPSNIIYWLTRRRDIQQIAYLGIARPTAAEVLKVKPKTERLPSNTLFQSFGKTGTETPYTASVHLFDFKRRLTERGLDPFLPIIEAKDNLFEINTVGIFNKNTFVKTLSAENTKLLNLFLLSNISRIHLKVEQDDLYFLINGENKKIDYSIRTPAGKSPTINVHIDISGMIEEALFKVRESDIPRYEKAAEEYLQKQIEQLLQGLQAENLDPIGFGLRYRSRHFENRTEWDTWQSIYPEVNFNVVVHVKIEGVGLIE